MRDALKIAFLFGYNSCLGIFLTYGVFFNVVASEFHQHPLSTSEVFALFAAAYSVSSLVFGKLMMGQGASRAILVGGILMAGGLAASSLAQSILMLELTYGVVAGLGSGAMWLPTSYAVFESFEQSKIRNVTGVVSAGTAFGSLFFGPFEAVSIVRFGWRLTFVFLALIVWFFGFGAYLGSRPRVGRARNKQDDSAGFGKIVAEVATRRDFLTLYAYYMLGNAFARTIVMIFVVPMLESRGLSLVFSSLAPALIGAGSMVGRTLTGLARLSEERASGLSFIVQGLSSLILVYVANPLLVLLLSFMFGVGYGGYIPQFALIVRKRYGMSNYSAVFSLLLTSFGVGASFGPILAGYSLMVSKGYAQMFLLSSLVSLIIGAHQMATSGNASGSPA